MLYRVTKGRVLVVGHIPVELFLSLNYFFDVANTSNGIFYRTCNFSFITFIFHFKIL